MDNKNRKEILDFIADTNDSTMAGPSISSHYILWAVLAFFVVAIIWAYFAVIEEVTRGQGKVVPSGETQMIQNLEGGIVKEILVKEGDLVEKGQPLMIIDDTRFASSYNESISRSAAYAARISRLMAESENKDLVFLDVLMKNYPSIVQQEKELYNSRKDGLMSKLSSLRNVLKQKATEFEELQIKKARLERSLGLINQELSLTIPLLKEGAVSQVEIIRLERQANDIKGDLDTAIVTLPRVKSALQIAMNSIQELKATFRTDALNELTKVKAEYDALSESNKALEDRVDRTKVRSPVKGTVNNIFINTIGGVIQPGMNLIEIVPIEDSLLIQAQIKPADIGFIHPGQKAMVKITAYDYSIYGGLNSAVEYISADTVKNEKNEYFYEIRARTTKNYLVDKTGKHLTIIPGMMATVDILTGQKSILNYLLKPILKAKYNALRER